MTNLLQIGASWLADQMKTHASIDVTYERGAEQVPIKATVGKTEFELDDGSGVVVRIQSRDYLIHAADLVLGGVETLPVAGDLIREAQGPTIFVYEVMAPGNEPHYRYSDSFRKLLRIHTKHVATEGS
ncbi:MAG: hypothetical protein KDB14_34740 [Planctomycetales bacterium]|nr:hypothetical protein [Planctomycetales bacterium]